MSQLADVKVSDWQKVAANIINNRHLRAFLLANQAADRQDIYDTLVPLLSFKAKPYFLLIS